MNAFAKIASGVGNAADALLLGGAVGKTRRRNQFADYIEGGDHARAADFALRHNEPGYAQMAREQGAAQQQSMQARQREQAAILGRIAQYGDNLPMEARGGYVEAIAPILKSQFDLDDEDIEAARLAAGQQNGFGALAAAFIDPQQQFDNRMGLRQQDEKERAARAGEGFRGSEIDISRGRLGLDRERLGEDRRQFDQTRSDKIAADEQASAIALDEQRAEAASALRSVQSRGQRIQLIADKFDEAIERTQGAGGRFSTGPVFGNPIAKRTLSPSIGLDAAIDTVRANIGFEELNEMRRNSPTGGALGQVTERELAFLQSVLGDLRQNQTREGLRKNLEDAKQEVIQSWARVMDAYRQDYGVDYHGPGASLAGGPPEPAPQRADPAPQQEIPEGATATNPQTGERIIYRDGQWRRL